MQGVLIRVRTEGKPEVIALNKEIANLKTGASSAGAGAAALGDGIAGAGKKAKEAQDSIKNLENGVGALGVRIRNTPISLNVASVASVAAVGLALGAVSAAAISSAAEMKRMSEKTGVAVEDLSVLTYAAGVTGLSVNQLGVTFRLLEKHMDDSLEGNKTAIRNFKELGISMDDLKTKSPKDVLIEVAAGLEKLTDPAQRAAKAQELLGRSGAEMLPMLHLLATDGFNSVAKEAAAMGVVISTDTANQAFQFEQAMFKTKAQLMSVGLTIATAVLPFMNNFLDAMNDSGKTATNYLNPLRLLKMALEGIAGAAATAGTAVGQALGGLENTNAGSAELTDYAKRKLAAKGIKYQENPLFANQSDTAGVLGQFWHGLTNPMESQDLEKQMTNLFDPLAKTGVTPPRIPGPRDDGAAQKKAADATAHLADETAKLTEQINKHTAAEMLDNQHGQLHIAALQSSGTLETIAIERQKAIIDLNAKQESSLQALNDEMAAHAKAISTAAKNGGTVDPAKEMALSIAAEHQKVALAQAGVTERIAIEFDAADKIAAYNADKLKEQVAFATDTIKNWLETRQQLYNAEIDKEKAKEAEFLNTFNTAFSQSVGRGLEDVLAGHGLGSAAKDFASSFAKVISKELGNGLSDLMANLQEQAQGGHFDPKTGHFIDGFDSKGQMITGDQQSRAKGLETALQVGSAALSLYQNGQSGVSKGANALAGAASGAGIGFEIGNAMPGIGSVVGAVAGALIGAVAGYMTGATKDKDKPFGTFGLNAGGHAYGYNAKNISPTEVSMYEQKIEDTYRQFWNGYVNILLKLPGASLPTLQTNITTDFSKGPTSDYLQHLDEWINKTLPDTLLKSFKVSFKSAITAAGVGSDQFERFWTEASNLKPDEALKFWSDMADGLNAFAQSRANMAAVNGVTGIGSRVGDARLGADGSQHIYGDSDFTTNLKSSTKGIFDIARQMVNLTGPDKVAAFKALGQSVQQVTQSLIDYVNQLAAASRNITESMRSSVFEHDLARIDPNAPDAKQQSVNMLTGEYQHTLDMIANAKNLGLSASDVESLNQHGQDLLNRIYQLDPTAAMDKWWHDQMTTLGTVSQAALKVMGDQAKSDVQKLLDEVQPFVDWFNGLPVDLNAALAMLTGPGGVFDGFAQALHDLIDRINGDGPVTPVDPGTGTGGGGGAGELPGPRNPIGGTDPGDPGGWTQVGGDSVGGGSDTASGQTVTIIVNVTMNGTSIGVGDIIEAAKTGAIEAIKRNPAKISSSYAVR